MVEAITNQIGVLQEGKEWSYDSGYIFYYLQLKNTWPWINTIWPNHTCYYSYIFGKHCDEPWWL